MNYLLKTIMRNLNFLNTDNNNHKSLRVRTNIGDTFLNVNLDQTYESLDILSLKIYQKDVYRLFDADYGIIVGRVTGQDVGIPNCRISVFIPTDEETIIGPTKIDDIKKIEAATLYPYQTVFDKDGNGKIYNLLPKYRRFRGLNGYPANEYGIGATPKTPVGSFFEKEEILSNESIAYVYDKYYKFSTLTNESGDYILVVPANRTYTVNMSCDITDIGKFSTTPELLKSENNLPDIYFTNDGLNINPEIPLERLPNIDIQNQTIYVKPLWSQNTDNTNVGINRLDFRILKKISPYVTVFGNFFTQNQDAWWNRNSGSFGDTNENDVVITTHKKGSLELSIYTLKNTISEYDASNGFYDAYDFNKDIELLPEFKYKFYQNNGNALITIPCNRNKVITNEFGELISVADDNEAGAFTSFRGYFWLRNTETVSNPDGSDQANKIRLRVPLLDNYVITNDPSDRRKIFDHYKFDYGEIYSWSQINYVRSKFLTPNDETPENQTNILYFGKIFQLENTDPTIKAPNANGGDFPGNSGDNGDKYKNFYNHIKCPYGTDDITRYAALKDQWMNFSLYFINFSYRQNTTFSEDRADGFVVQLDGTINTLDQNNQPLGAGVENTVFVANGSKIKTNFIKVNKEDLLKFRDYKINNKTQLGFRLPKSELKGSYLRNNLKTFDNQSNGESTQYMNQDLGDTVGERYFLIGQMSNNCIEYLFNYL